MRRIHPAALIGFIIALAGTTVPAAQKYAWLDDTTDVVTVMSRLPAPLGYTSIDSDSTGFAAWLRGLPLKPDDARVMVYDGSPRRDQSIQSGVLDIDIGSRDLQQCADAAIRLRAEYLWSQDRRNEIAFLFTSGDTASWVAWRDGWRPVVHGSDVAWRKSAAADSSYRNFREYLDTVFMYAGSYSLQRDLPRRESIDGMMPGDLFIDGGFPGHVVIVLDVAVHDESGERIFLAAQGFTPAQDFHVIVNPNDTYLSPWYHCDFGNTLVTPDWKFRPDQLHYFD